MSDSHLPHGRNNAIIMIAPVLLGIVGSIVAFNLLGMSANGQSVGDEVPNVGLTPAERTTVELFERTVPSVVNIQTSRREIERVGRFMFSERDVEGGGSGFVWDRHGHIVTNFHVIGRYFERRGQPFVELTDNVQVSLHDGTTHDATIVGYYVDRDLAVLRIDPSEAELLPIKLGDSDALLVGQDVLAIGNPFGLDSTVTRGIISALGREIQALSGVRIYDVIQTDAAINPGNSGGPLIDSAGRVIGINTQIKSDTRSSAGIGFAVPADVMKTIVPQLIENGGDNVNWPTMGIDLVRDEVARRSGVRSGVIVRRVYPGTGAARAGIEGLLETEQGVRIRDVIVAIDEKPIRRAGDLLAVLADYRRGDRVIVALLRGGEIREVGVELGAGAIE